MYILGIIVIACGLFLAVYGWYNSVEGKSLGAGLLGIISGSLLVFDDISLISLGVIGSVAFVVLTVIILKERFSINRSDKEKQAEAIGGTNLDKFFVECVLAETNDFSKDKNIQKAQLIAKKYNLTYPNGIKELYLKGYNAHQAVSQRFISNRLEKLRIEEQKEFERLNKYSDLIGKEKRITMLLDRADELRKNAKSKNRVADMMMQSGLQKECNSATWGGIANGIAGFGAGVATAIEVEQRNAQIRVANDKHRRAVMPAYMSVTGTAREFSNSADEIMQEIESFKLKLMSDLSAADLMKEITFDNTEVIVSETGTAKVCTVASINPDFRIFDDVEAVVDGTFIAKIYQENRLCGTAKMVLPMYGLRRNVRLEGICIDCCEAGKKYTAKFVAKNLWAMEA